MAGEKQADDEAMYQAEAAGSEQQSEAPPHAGSAGLTAAIEPDVDRPGNGPDDDGTDDGADDPEPVPPMPPDNDT